MTIPTATYRLQFRNGMTFDRAAALVPYLKRLGISHLYASPIFKAAAGSTHGYDVVDANEIDPAIGGRDGFDRMARALKAEGLGLILDIVPNHMAASLENAWWRDVIELGEKSQFARHFDIDWSRRLTLPFLGDSFEAVLAAGDIALKTDPDSGKPAFAYFGSFYPLTPASYAGREGVLQISDKAGIAALHDQQPYRLMSWRDAEKDLSYRRFFEITGLAGVRVEDEAVFDDTHRLVLELVRDGTVDGLRVDHVDGLADPEAYLRRLRSEAGPDCYITVEKILAHGEQMPRDWPVSGTTGYEFIASISQALVDGGGLQKLHDAYAHVTGEPVDPRRDLRAAKLLMADKNFAGEFAALVRLALEVRASDQHEPFLSDASVTTALKELLVAFPVYRTYGSSRGLPLESRTMLEHVLQSVRQRRGDADPEAIGFIERILKEEVDGPASAAALNFRTRFQQLTGPLMAKSVEDTLFYRLHVALALNEVGGEPLPSSFSLERFHTDMANRLVTQPDGLSATSTHDTKRGEDARARLYTITEAPGIWAEAVARWRSMNRLSIQSLADGPAPEPAVEWMIYQALAGAWPTDLRADDEKGIGALEKRFLPFIEKALREAKLRTNWGEPNEDYEAAVMAYARNLLSTANRAFLIDFVGTLEPFVRSGLANSLTQTLIKLAAPGVADIYQGCEGHDFSLVDPDNRREPDFQTLQQLLFEHGTPTSPRSDWQSQGFKQQLVATLLHLRQQAPTLFRTGEYLPLVATGDDAARTLAFARADAQNALVIIAPRLVFSRFTAGALSRETPPTRCSIALPPTLANRPYRNLWSGERIGLSDSITIGFMNDQPFLALWAE
ncbi:malto-oligosyltrehalose synthase [Rhizobium sp. BK418]|uniref:malto-oligosyltrehalose synthase n=1 Tax=Rhizobium sp. BK418 TaxID=2512120 RepID=UPI00104CEEA2|nr:malto-oligosyltrehalose synthase [Rhizobium sp. BK418]TCR96316.1 maltooligosyl trehalose synthase [Rhizobium sp. BK418]